jgi:hypothetical protein
MDRVEQIEAAVNGLAPEESTGLSNGFAHANKRGGTSNWIAIPRGEN